MTYIFPELFYQKLNNYQGHTEQVTLYPLRNPAIRNILEVELVEFILILSVMP